MYGVLSSVRVVPDEKSFLLTLEWKAVTFAIGDEESTLSEMGALLLGQLVQADEIQTHGGRWIVVMVEQNRKRIVLWSYAANWHTILPQEWTSSWLTNEFVPTCNLPMHFELLDSSGGIQQEDARRVTERLIRPIFETLDLLQHIPELYTLIESYFLLPLVQRVTHAPLTPCHM